MRYVLMICGDEAKLSGSDEEGSVISDCAEWNREMKNRGVLQSSEGLHSSDDATTVRVRGDEILLSDGPFAETKDQIGGFSLIECADLDEAIEVASRHPATRVGQIEIRPVREP